MPKIIVNYKYDKKKDEYKVLNYDVIFADMPIAVMEMGSEYEEILVVPIRNVATIVDKKDYLSKNKLFRLKVKEQNVFEDANGIPIYLPKDTDVTKLKYINNQIVLCENKEE